jgi:hypothetical protein
MTSAAWRPGRALCRAIAFGLACNPLATDAADAQQSDEIVVTGVSARGAVRATVPPEVTLDAGSIAAMGASNVADIIAQLSAQTGGAQGRAGEGNVVLLNGRRISSLGEVRNLPPEAVSRVEVLAEEAALRFGYSAHQKVINIVLLPSFASVTGELEDRVAEATTRNDFNTEANIVRIAGDNRITFDLQYQIGDDLTEAARGVVSSRPGTGTLRTVLPLTHHLTANGVFARALGKGMAFTGNASFDRLTSRALIGPMVSDPLRPLERTTRTDTAHAGGVVNGALSAWTWSVTANADRTAVTIVTAADGGTAAKRSRSIDDLLGIDAVASGPVATLPAGDITLSSDVAASSERITARDRTGLDNRLTRRALDGQVALDIPILDRHSALGAAGVGANVRYRYYSDMGAPADRGWTLTWSPRPNLSLLIAGNREAAQPTLRQLGDPLTASPEIRFFDYGAGASISANRLDGGDPNLRHDQRTLFKVEATLKPSKALSFIATYSDLSTRDALVAFPGISPLFEAAYPGRVQRDPEGAIVGVDARPINLSRQDHREIRIGLNFNRSWAASGGPTLPGGNAFGGGHYFGANGTTLQFAIYDSIRLAETSQLAPGQPEVDLIRNNVLGEGLRASRHTIDAQLSATAHGFGLRANATWRSSAAVAQGLPGALRFDEPITLNLRFFFFPAQQARIKRAAPWLAGVRILLAIDNILDQATTVRDHNGLTPPPYQRGYLDPTGRSFRLSIRKTLE